MKISAGLLLAAVALASSCSGDSAGTFAVAVAVKSDLRPAIDFDAVTVVITARDGKSFSDVYVASASDDFGRRITITRFDNVASGTAHVRADLQLDGAVVATKTNTVNVEGDVLVLVEVNGTDAPADGGLDAPADAAMDATPDGSVVVESCTDIADGTACVDGATSGHCYAEACCTGCFDGDTCVAGTTESACGKGGTACAACECDSDTCTDQACTVTNKAVEAEPGYEHTCAITEDGKLWCWGSNDRGVLGTGNQVAPQQCQSILSGSATEEDCFPTPRAVTAPGVGRTWAHIATGTRHTCALDDQGTAYCWGHDAYGQLGNGDFGNSTIPINIGGTWSRLAAGAYGNCAIQTSDGALYCWGRNDKGQVGVNSQVNVLSPTLLGAGTPALQTGWDEVDLGFWHACGRHDDDVYCWGRNDTGQVGPNVVEGSGDDPMYYGLVPTEVPFDDPVVHVTVGYNASCAQTATSASCWGNNASAQYGNGTQTAGGSTPTTVSWGVAGLATMDSATYVCIVTAAGALYCWGSNRYGQIGVGTNGGGTAEVNQKTPIRVGTRSDWTFVSPGRATICGIVASGALYCWGRNNMGQTGRADSLPQNTSTDEYLATIGRVCLD